MTDDPTQRRNMTPAPQRRVTGLRVFRRDEATTIPLLVPMTVGRGANADLVIDDRSLSRVHARMVNRGGEVWIEDLDSTNGVLLNGSGTRATVLRVGDRLDLGDVVIVPISMEASPASWHPYEELAGLATKRMVPARTNAVGLLMLEAGGPSGHLAAWCDPVERHLRPSDQIASLGTRSMLVLWERASFDEMRTQVEQLVAHHRGYELRASLVQAPDHGDTWEQLLEAAREALRLHAGPQVRVPGTPGDAVFVDDPLVTASPSMQRAVALCERVAASDGSVLLVGETGTGKELLARHIHRQSGRPGPFMAVPCSSLNGTTMLAQLFGFDRGAFTGAVGESQGLLEAASGGSLLLDQVGELGAEAQAALLRVLALGRIRRLGSTEERAVSVRVIATSTEDLERLVRAGEFREDLYYRLNRFVVSVPPLRERTEDLPGLIDHFLTRVGSRRGHAGVEMDDAAFSYLLRQSWPGNVRQLKNAVERAYVLADDGPLRLGDFEAGAASGPRSLKQQVAAFEQEMIRRAMEDSGGNKTAAAKRLRMPLRTFMNKCPPEG